MRIISGKLKGKSISFLKSETTRPLKDSIKENIFNIIIHSNLININLEKSNILDLYSGIGSFGLECLSRGAESITFVEKDKEVARILNENLISLSLESKSNLIEDKISNFLKTKNDNKFEIIFLDPPFAEEGFVNDLKLILKNKIYKKNHIIIIHRERKSTDNLEGVIKTLFIREYGRSKIIFGNLLINSEVCIVSS